MKPVDVKWNTYIDSSKEINDKSPRFKVGDIVRIPKHKNIFTKGYVPNWSEEVFLIKKVKCTVPWTFVISYLKGKEIVLLEHFKKKNYKSKSKANQKEFRVEKVIKRIGNKLYIKWKGYDSSFNSWIDKKYIV